MEEEDLFGDDSRFLQNSSSGRSSQHMSSRGSMPYHTGGYQGQPSGMGHNNSFYGYPQGNGGPTYPMHQVPQPQPAYDPSLPVRSWENGRNYLLVLLRWLYFTNSQRYPQIFRDSESRRNLERQIERANDPQLKIQILRQFQNDAGAQAFHKDYELWNQQMLAFYKRYCKAAVRDQRIQTAVDAVQNPQGVFDLENAARLNASMEMVGKIQRGVVKAIARKIDEALLKRRNEHRSSSTPQGQSSPPPPSQTSPPSQPQSQQMPPQAQYQGQHQGQYVPHDQTRPVGTPATQPQTQAHMQQSSAQQRAYQQRLSGQPQQPALQPTPQQLSQKPPQQPQLKPIKQQQQQQGRQMSPPPMQQPQQQRPPQQLPQQQQQQQRPPQQQVPPKSRVQTAPTPSMPQMPSQKQQPQQPRQLLKQEQASPVPIPAQQKSPQHRPPRPASVNSTPPISKTSSNPALQVPRDNLAGSKEEEERLRAERKQKHAQFLEQERRRLQLEQAKIDAQAKAQQVSAKAAKQKKQAAAPSRQQPPPQRTYSGMSASQQNASVMRTASAGSGSTQPGVNQAVAMSARMSVQPMAMTPKQMEAARYTANPNLMPKQTKAQQGQARGAARSNSMNSMGTVPLTKQGSIPSQTQPGPAARGAQPTSQYSPSTMAPAMMNTGMPMSMTTGPQPAMPAMSRNPSTSSSKRGSRGSKSPNSSTSRPGVSTASTGAGRGSTAGRGGAAAAGAGSSRGGLGGMKKSPQPQMGGRGMGVTPQTSTQAQMNFAQQQMYSVYPQPISKMTSVYPSMTAPSTTQGIKRPPPNGGARPMVRASSSGGSSITSTGTTKSKKSNKSNKGAATNVMPSPAGAPMAKTKSNSSMSKIRLDPSTAMPTTTTNNTAYIPNVVQRPGTSPSVAPIVAPTSTTVAPPRSSDASSVTSSTSRPNKPKAKPKTNRQDSMGNKSIGPNDTASKVHPILKLDHVPMPREMTSPLVRERVKHTLGSSLVNPMQVKDPNPCVEYLSSALDVLIRDSLVELLGLSRHRAEGESQRRHIPEVSKPFSLSDRLEILKKRKLSLAAVRKPEEDLEALFTGLNERMEKDTKSEKPEKSSSKSRKDAAADKKKQLMQSENSNPGTVHKLMQKAKTEQLMEYRKSERSFQDMFRKSVEQLKQTSSTRDQVLVPLMSQTRGSRITVSMPELRTFLDVDYCVAAPKVRRIWAKCKCVQTLET